MLLDRYEADEVKTLPKVELQVDFIIHSAQSLSRSLSKVLILDPPGDTDVVSPPIVHEDYLYYSEGIHFSRLMGFAVSNISVTLKGLQ